MDIDTGRRRVQVLTRARGKVYKYTFDRDGDDLYLVGRQEAADPGVGKNPRYSQGPREISSSVRSALNSRGFSVHKTQKPEDDRPMGPDLDTMF